MGGPKIEFGRPRGVGRHRLEGRRGGGVSDLEGVDAVRGPTRRRATDSAASDGRRSHQALHPFLGASAPAAAAAYYIR